MFRRFREKIERALERREAQRPLTRDDLERLFHEMRDEVIALRSRIPKLEAELKGLDDRAVGQVRRAELAHGKAQQAQSAGDSPEARVALEAAEAALQHAADLRRQADEGRQEVARLRTEADEKLQELKSAERNRDVLLARARRAGTAQRLDDLIRGPESGVRRFERAEEDLQTAEDLAAAAREVEESLGGRRTSPDTEYELRQLERAQREDDIERRLADLKREIERESE